MASFAALACLDCDDMPRLLCEYLACGLEQRSCGRLEIRTKPARIQKYETAVQPAAYTSMLSTDTQRHVRLQQSIDRQAQFHVMLYCRCASTLRPAHSPSTSLHQHAAGLACKLLWLNRTEQSESKGSNLEVL